MSMINAHPMEILKQKLKCILDVVPPGAQVYYIDYPVYSNGGDILIMKGTEKFLADNKIEVLKRYSAMDFPENLYIPEGVIILLQGGGNFGDLYLSHQRLREQIVTSYPSHRIVVLPQTIYYKEQEEYDKTAAIFNRHKDLHIYTRDKSCYELAKIKFESCHIYLSPDMAHQLWPIIPKNQSILDKLYFLRTDIEGGKEPEDLSGVAQENCYDWSSLFSYVEKKIIGVFVKLHSIKRKTGIKLSVDRLWYKYADYLIKKTVKLFGKYRSVQTSRLHGHILSCLMDKENILIDNSYGKNLSYYNTWTYQCKNTHLHVSGSILKSTETKSP
jgi:pyruvyl transferase EpsO